jgi:hypothetical protein
MSLKVGLSLQPKWFLGESECSGESIIIIVHTCGHRGNIFAAFSVQEKEGRSLIFSGAGSHNFPKGIKQDVVLI